MVSRMPIEAGLVIEHKSDLFRVSLFYWGDTEINITYLPDTLVRGKTSLIYRHFEISKLFYFDCFS